MAFDVFLSYSHSTEPGLARALQRDLQNLGRTPFGRGKVRVFRDETNLAANPDLWSSVHEHLQQANHFILLASPTSSARPWVRREIVAWLTGADTAVPDLLDPESIRPDRAGNLLIILTEGEIASAPDSTGRILIDWSRTDALPAFLSKCITAVPMWVDLRWTRAAPPGRLSLRNAEWTDAVLRLSAPVRGLDPQELLGLEVAAQRRVRTLVIAIAAIFVVLVVLAASLWIRSVQAESARQRAVLQAGESAKLAMANEQNEHVQRHLALTDAGFTALDLANKTEAMHLFAAAIEVEEMPVDPAAKEEYQRHKDEFEAAYRDLGPYLMGTASTTPNRGALRPGTPSRYRLGIQTEEFYGLAEILPPRDAKGLFFYNKDLTNSLAGLGGLGWDQNSGDRINNLKHGPWYYSWYADIYNSAARSRYIQIHGDDCTIKTIEASGMESPGSPVQLHFEKAGPVLYAKFSPDASKVAIALNRGPTTIRDATTGTELYPLPGPTGGIRSIRWNKAGTALLTASADKTVRLWHLPDQGSPPLTFTGKREMNAAEFSPREDALVMASGDGTFQVYDAQSGSLKLSVQGHSQGIVYACFSHNGEMILTLGFDRTAKLWKANNGELLSEMHHLSGIFSADFSDDDSEIRTRSWDGEERLWKKVHPKQQSSLTITAGMVKGVIQGGAFFDGAGRRLVTSFTSSPVQLWDATDNPQKPFVLKNGDVFPDENWRLAINHPAAISEDGSWIAAIGYKRMWIGNPDTSETRRLDVDRQPEGPVRFSPDNRALVFPTIEGGVVADLADGTSILLNRGPTSAYQLVKCVALNRDGTAVTGMTDGQLRTFDLHAAESESTLAPREVIPVFSDTLSCVQYSHGGQTVVVGSFGGEATLFDLVSRKPASVLRGHSKVVSFADFTPDDGLIATAAWDGTARIWDAATGEEIGRFQHGSPESQLLVFTVQFHPTKTGMEVVTASSDAAVRLWRFAAVAGEAEHLPRWIEVLSGTTLENGIVRCLSESEWEARRWKLAPNINRIPDCPGLEDFHR